MPRFRGELRTPEEMEAAIMRGDVAFPGITVTPLYTTSVSSMPASSNRRHVIAPQDHWDEFKVAADKEKLSVSEWLCRAGVEKLPKKIQAQLSKRPGVGQPKKPEPKES